MIAATVKRLSRWIVLFVLLLPTASYAQLGGFNTKGDFGLLAGTQAPPGFWFIPLFYDYKGDTLRDRDGNQLSATNSGSADARAAVLGLMYVTEKKILGGNYGFAFWPGITNNAMGVPPLQIDEKVSTGFADLYVQPFMLGWNTSRADFLAGVGIYAPTGEFEIDGEENRGLGMWGFELFGATTLYLNEEKTWHFATIAAWETHTKKKDTDIRVGNLVTLEGGLGKSFMGGLATAGLAYYAQWKVSDDDFGELGDLPIFPAYDRNRVFAFGPEISVPLASQSKLYGFFNIRFLFESGARSTLEGTTLVVTFTFPSSSIPLQ